MILIFFIPQGISSDCMSPQVLPYKTVVQGGLYPGKIITVQGCMNHDADRCVYSQGQRQRRNACAGYRAEIQNSGAESSAGYIQVQFKQYTVGEAET